MGRDASSREGSGHGRRDTLEQAAALASFAIASFFGIEILASALGRPDSVIIISVRPGELLRAARARARLTQRALAEKTGIPQPTIAAIESGAQDPRFKTLDRLTRACGYDLDLVRHGGEGEDRTLFRENLRLTPAQRLAHAEQGVRTLRLLGLARRSR